MRVKSADLSEDVPLFVAKLSDDLIALFYSEVKQNLQISSDDGHPNAITQQQMTDFLYEKIKD